MVSASIVVVTLPRTTPLLWSRWHRLAGPTARYPPQRWTRRYIRIAAQGDTGIMGTGTDLDPITRCRRAHKLVHHSIRGRRLWQVRCEKGDQVCRLHKLPLELCHSGPRLTTGPPVTAESMWHLHMFRVFAIVSFVLFATMSSTS
jgi:hypothetical protein